MRVSLFWIAVLFLTVKAELVERDESLQFTLPTSSSSVADASSGDSLSLAISTSSTVAPTASSSASAAGNSADGSFVVNSADKQASSSASVPTASLSSSSSVVYPSVSIPSAYSTSSAYNVMSAPASVAATSGNITSNVTSTTAKLTATWNGTLPQLISQMYRGSEEAEANLPHFYWNLANASLSETQLQMICDSQTKFCATSGCTDNDDQIAHNFCDTSKGMATMCTCSKSASRLPQYQWPVQAQDCLLRLQACSDACNNQRTTPFAQRNACAQACADQIGSSCGKTEQYGSTYAVKKPGQSPSYLIVDQSNPQSAAFHTSVHLVMSLCVVLTSCFALVTL
ncbi:hypothetical protein MYAM1_002805 [Malassezia yamatoensis]|uniref:Uncharacterized protein n=1 Tax=Malassezia yamatoensis TaxID=253288 RepID=A0AAJ5YVI3_9BASI|nr:hypothetical protein MYAM1_002805 [Malassezia yamatoensis]